MVTDDESEEDQGEDTGEDTKGGFDFRGLASDPEGDDAQGVSRPWGSDHGGNLRPTAAMAMAEALSENLFRDRMKNDV